MNCIFTLEDCKNKEENIQKQTIFTKTKILIKIVEYQKMFISHNNVASGVLIFLFTIFRVTLAINLEYRTSEILRINQYIGNYTQWLIANGPFHHKVIDKPMVNCLDIAISYSEKSRSSHNMLQHEYEEYFATTLFHEMFAERKMSIKNRSKFARFEEKYFCHYFMVISFNETQLFQDIQQWSLTRKSKYLIVVFPYDIINFNRNSSKTIRDPMQWPIQHVFTHAQVMLVVNYDIYKLSSPFNAEMSQLIKISVEKFKAWEPHNLLVSDFQGKRLMVSTLHCPPQNYWNDDRSSVGVDTPGAMETMCNEKELSRHYENNFGMKTCREYEQFQIYWNTRVINKFSSIKTILYYYKILTRAMIVCLLIWNINTFYRVL